MNVIDSDSEDEKEIAVCNNRAFLFVKESLARTAAGAQ